MAKNILKNLLATLGILAGLIGTTFLSSAYGWDFAPLPLRIVGGLAYIYIALSVLTPFEWPLKGPLAHLGATYLAAALASTGNVGIYDLPTLVSVSVIALFISAGTASIESGWFGNRYSVNTLAAVAMLLALLP